MSRPSHRGFTLIEVLLAMWILLVGAVPDELCPQQVALGFLLAALHGSRFGITFGVLGLSSGAAFVLIPQWSLWNERLIPLWFISLYLLAAYFVGSAAAAIDVQIVCNREPIGSVTLQKYISTLLK